MKPQLVPSRKKQRKRTDLSQQRREEEGKKDETGCTAERICTKNNTTKRYKMPPGFTLYRKHLEQKNRRNIQKMEKGN